jgi:hypothetical protein
VAFALAGSAGLLSFLALSAELPEVEAASFLAAAL